MNRRSSSLRRMCVALVLAVTMALAGLAQAGPVGATGAPDISVMTRNLYLGADLTPLVTSPDFVAAVGETWATVQATDFPRRAKALATEIQLTRPDVIGLQEVSQFQVLSLTDGHVEEEIDFLALLQDELAARGLSYKDVSTSRNADVVAPLPPDDSPSAVHFVDRDVILARSSLSGRLGPSMNDHYEPEHQLTVTPTAAGVPPLEFTRGWASIDYQIAKDQTVRIFDTHLETLADLPAVGDPTKTVQFGQAGEFAELVDDSPYPVIALGDFNSGPGSPSTATYDLLVARGLRDTWRITRPNTPGLTCCQNELLTGFTPPPTERIDLVWTKGPWHHDFAIRTGVFPFRQAPPPIWASDHFGVWAHLTLH